MVDYMFKKLTSNYTIINVFPFPQGKWFNYMVNYMFKKN